MVEQSEVLSSQKKQRPCKLYLVHRNAVIRKDDGWNRPEAALFDHQAVEVHFIEITAWLFLIRGEPRFCRCLRFRRCVEQTIVVCAS